MCKARHILLLSTIIFLGLFVVFQAGPALAQRSVTAVADNPADLCSRACKQYLSGNGEESLALYQKAIVQAESQYGKNARMTGSLYYEMGVRALSLSKFNLAERCFKKATEINPHSQTAQLMLVHLLRFRDRDGEAVAYAQRLLKKHWDSKEARRDLMLCLQEKDPEAATQQAFIINCLQNDTLNKIPGFERQEKPIEQIQPSPSTGNGAAKEEKPGTVQAAKAPGSGQSTSVAKESSKSAISEKAKTPQQLKSKQLRTGSNKTKTFRAKQIPSPAKAKPARSRKGRAKSAALVPPPPPIQLPSFAGMQAGLKAITGSMKLENITGGGKPKGTKEKAKQSESTGEKASEKQSGEAKPSQAIQAQKRAPSDVDPDFLLEWAGKKKSVKK